MPPTTLATPAAPFLLTAPRDGRTPVRERLEWLTDLQTSRNGAERRTGLRARPRHFMGVEVLLHTPQARASIDALLGSGADFIVPLYQHVFERPAVAPDAGLNMSSSSAAGPVGRGGLVFVGQVEGRAELLFWPDPNWPPEHLGWPLHPWAGIAAPAALARLTGQSRQLAIQARNRASTQLEFLLLDYEEQPGEWDGLTVDGAPSLDAIAPHAQPGSLSASVAQADYDNGLGDPLRRAFHSKETHDLSFVLTSRADILAFRRLLFALRGRLNPVHYSPPIQGQASGLFRLATDIVELQYLSPSLARVSLTLTRLPTTP